MTTAVPAPAITTTITAAAVCPVVAVCPAVIMALRDNDNYLNAFGELFSPPAPVLTVHVGGEVVTTTLRPLFLLNSFLQISFRRAGRSFFRYLFCSFVKNA
ncbi:MAG: hypothetical protein IKH53_09095 [Muribaculaceae bacterium]|nr:hypothetical protein [Muribaculaceae bacterium]